MSLTYAVFCSPKVTQGTEWYLLQDAFKHFNLTVSFYPIQKCRTLAPKLDADVFVAAGGDGTVNCVASQAYQLRKPLGIVPLGTLNHFAHDIGIPLVLFKAVETIVQGKTIKTDIGTVNDTVFLNNSSVGIYPTIVRTRIRLEKLIGKWPAAVVTIFLIVPRQLYIYKIKLTLDGVTINTRSSLFFVGNNTYSLKGLGLPTRDNLWQGKLHIYVLKTKRLDRLLKTVWYSLLSKRLPERYINRYEGKLLKVQIHSRKRVSVALDGEISRMSTPLEFKLLPKALSVIVSHN